MAPSRYERYGNKKVNELVDALEILSSKSPQGKNDAAFLAEPNFKFALLRWSTNNLSVRRLPLAAARRR
jgi:hypothetical protein